MLVEFVTVADIASGWRPLTAEQESVAAAKISEALIILEVEAPGVLSRAESGELSPDIVRLVVTRMVTRYLKNPDGDRTVTDSESIDDYTVSSTRIKDNSLASGDMFVTPVELGWLGVRVKAPSAFEIALGGSV